MENRVKELIAVGASITAGCQPCLQYHVHKARESGAEEEEILAAVAVAKMVRKGAMAKMDKFAATVAEAAQTSQTGSETGCGCSESAAEA